MQRRRAEPRIDLHEAQAAEELQPVHGFVAKPARERVYSLAFPEANELRAVALAVVDRAPDVVVLAAESVCAELVAGKGVLDVAEIKRVWFFES